MELWDFVLSNEGRQAAKMGIDDAHRMLPGDLRQNRLGGTQLAFNIRFIRVIDGAVFDFVPDDMVYCDVPDPENGAYNYRAIAAGKRELSTRTRMSARHAIATGLRRDDEVEWLGNTVGCLDAEGKVTMIVSCSGLSDIGDEVYAELMYAHIKRQVLVRWRAQQTI